MTSKVTIMFYLWAALLFTLTQSKLIMSSIFSHSCILQTNAEYGARSFVYGVASPLDSVTVLLTIEQSGKTHTNITILAAADGKFSVTLNPLSESLGLIDLTVTTGSGDVHKSLGCEVGDVYLCGGQSNMCFSAESAFAPAQDLVNMTYSNIKLFAVNMIGNATPQSDFPPLGDTPQCSWNHDKQNSTTDPSYVCNAWMPSIPSTNRYFSAVCLFTALEIAKQHTGTRKIGLIYSAFGGTSISLWSPPAAYESCPGQAAPAPAPGSLFNAMISPLVGYTIRAALFFQGEQDISSESKTPGWYECRFERLIAYWRNIWGIGDFTFTFVQLGSVLGATTEYGQLRVAQTFVLPHPNGTVDNTAMAVAYDLGDRNQSRVIGSVHFRNKTEVGRRLAASILHAQFGLQNATLLNPSIIKIVQENDSLLYIFIKSATDAIALQPAGECVECCMSQETIELSSDNGSTWVNTSMSLFNTSVIQVVPSTTSTSFTHIRYAFHDMVECAIVDVANDFPLPTFSLSVVTAAAINVNTATATAIATAASAAAISVNTATAASAGVTSHLIWRGQYYPLQADAVLPPLGLNTWNAFHNNVDELLILAISDAFVSLGLRDIGYRTVNIDDGWQVDRDDNGIIVPDPIKFPSGMSSLAAAVHSRGLKFGLYTSQTSLTCQDRPGTYNYEAIDAATWCEWNIDYIKVDLCGGQRWPHTNESWILIDKALSNATLCPNGPLVVSVEYCNSASCGPSMSSLATLWRTTGDVQPNFESIMSNLDNNNLMAPFHTPGHFNDPDMLCLGDSGVSLIEAQTQFSAWALVAAPLLLSFNIVSPAGVDPTLLAIISNKEVIAVSQDAAQVQGIRVSEPSPTGNECWARPLAPLDTWGGENVVTTTNAVAALFINRGPIEGSKSTVVCTWAMLGIPPSTIVTIRDLISHANLGNSTSDLIQFQVMPHDSRLVKLEWT